MNTKKNKQSPDIKKCLTTNDLKNPKIYEDVAKMNHVASCALCRSALEGYRLLLEQNTIADLEADLLSIRSELENRLEEEVI